MLEKRTKEMADATEKKEMKRIGIMTRRATITLTLLVRIIWTCYPTLERMSWMAERTGLEPATPGVTGRYSNQLNYRSNRWWVLRGSNPRPSPCKGDALPLS